MVHLMIHIDIFSQLLKISIIYRTLSGDWTLKECFLDLFFVSAKI